MWPCICWNGDYSLTVLSFELAWSSHPDIYFDTASAKPVSLRARVLYINQSINQSTNQSTDQTQGSKSFNQPINPIIYYWFLLIALIKQSINQSMNLSVPWYFKYTQSINWPPFQNQFFSLNCWGLQVLIAFCTVLDDGNSLEMPANGTVRWLGECGEEGTEPGDWVLV